MNPILSAWNADPEQTAIDAMLACCGATRWAAAMAAARPILTPESLYAIADRLWSEMQESDWLQAFACHPRIGSRKPAHASAQSQAWSNQEQSSTQTAADQTLAHLSALNTQYEERFGFTYIICATGKSAEEMLAILERRLSSDRSIELSVAAEQQRQITHIRLKKWLTE
jgi:2-oxo-4-hydroxy-4-carboxy-5-ureidoimidazoline decarboxylase